MFALVRHAHAGDQDKWDGQDEQRPLSARGLQQAQGVADNLRAMDVSSLVSSPYQRCQQTLAPLATMMGLLITSSDLLRPNGSISRLDRWLADPDLDGAVLCTHGEVLNDLLDFWRRRDVLDVATGAGRGSGLGDGRSSTEKGATWIVETDGPRRSLHYMRPVQVGPSLAT